MERVRNRQKVESMYLLNESAGYQSIRGRFRQPRLCFWVQLEVGHSLLRAVYRWRWRKHVSFETRGSATPIAHSFVAYCPATAAGAPWRALNGLAPITHL